jgi:uncharacterized RDD family membrane protein YckC
MNRGTVRYAGFWRRVAALILDYVLFSSILFLINYSIHGTDYLRWTMNPQRTTYNITDALLTFVLWPAVIALFWVKMAATPGKLLLGCRVVDAATFKPLRFGQALLRCFSYVISFIPLCFGFICVAWDARKQGLHDKIARSVVIVEDEADQLLQEWQERR